jgi:hypothetical protein
MKNAVERIDVAGVPFEVIERRASEVRTLDGNYGEISPIEGKIWMNGKASTPIREVSLLHEWFHGICDANGVEHSEVITNVITSELYRQGFRAPRWKCPPKSTKGRVSARK